MSKVLAEGGYGPGISHAVAERFGRAGFSLALVARNAGKLVEAAARLGGQGYTARAFPADLSNLGSMPRAHEISLRRPPSKSSRG